MDSTPDPTTAPPPPKRSRGGGGFPQRQPHPRVDNAQLLDLPQDLLVMVFGHLLFPPGVGSDVVPDAEPWPDLVSGPYAVDHRLYGFGKRLTVWMWADRYPLATVCRRFRDAFLHAATGVRMELVDQLPYRPQADGEADKDGPVAPDEVAQVLAQRSAALAVVLPKLAHLDTFELTFAHEAGPRCATPPPWVPRFVLGQLLRAAAAARRLRAVRWAGAAVAPDALSSLLYRPLRWVELGALDVGAGTGAQTDARAMVVRLLAGSSSTLRVLWLSGGCCLSLGLVGDHPLARFLQAVGELPHLHTLRIMSKEGAHQGGVRGWDNPTPVFLLPELGRADLGSCHIRGVGLIAGLCQSCPLKALTLPEGPADHPGVRLVAAMAGGGRSPRRVSLWGVDFAHVTLPVWRAALGETADLTLRSFRFERPPAANVGEAPDPLPAVVAALSALAALPALRRLCLGAFHLPPAEVALLALPRLEALTIERGAFGPGSAAALAFALAHQCPAVGHVCLRKCAGEVSSGVFGMAHVARLHALGVTEGVEDEEEANAISAALSALQVSRPEVQVYDC